MPLTVGTRVGHYEIAEAIGAGGMGVVFRARDHALGRDVAVKVLPAAFADDDERRQRFAREARLLAALNHPHIAQVYGIEDSSAGSAIVMELVPGRTLRDLIRSRAISSREALGYARQVALALDAAHEKGIIHRDLKPEGTEGRRRSTLYKTSSSPLIGCGLPRRPSRHDSRQSRIICPRPHRGEVRFHPRH